MKVKKWVVVISVKEVEVDSEDSLETPSPGPNEDETYISYPFDSKGEAKKIIESLLLKDLLSL